MKRTIGFGLAALAVLGLGQLGVFARLGAHPFWSDVTVPALGVLAGAGLYLVGLWRFSAGAIAGLVILVGAAAAARFGKQIFAASYAENALAGDFWFFGWILICGSCVALAGMAFDRLAFRR